MPKAGEHRVEFIETFKNRLESAFDSGKPPFNEGWILPIALDAAVPLWQNEFRYLTWDEKEEILKNAQADELPMRMEYLLHRGPKEGDSARVFNDVARVIAVMSFVPGGIKLFGRRWEYGQIRVSVSRQGGRKVVKQ